MRTPDINKLRRKQNNSSGRSTTIRDNHTSTTNDSSDDNIVWFFIAYLYSVPSMIWMSFEHDFDYTFKELFRAILSPFRLMSLGEYWMAAGFFASNIIVSIVLLLLLLMLSEAVESNLLNTGTGQEGKVLLFYVLISILFMIVPLTQPW